MKRSDAIKIMVETMGAYDSWEEQCSYMLSQLEKAGLLPPEVFNIKYDFDLALKYDEHPFLMYPVKRYVHEWEQE